MLGEGVGLYNSSWCCVDNLAWKISFCLFVNETVNGMSHMNY